MKMTTEDFTKLAAVVSPLEAVETEQPRRGAPARWGGTMAAASVWLMEADRLIAALRDLPVAS